VKRSLAERAAVLILIAAAGCGAPPFPAYRLASTGARLGPDPARPPGPPAEPVRVVARAVLGSRSSEENLTLHLVLFPSGSAFLVAAGDFGRQVFAAWRTAGGVRSSGDPRRHPPELLASLLDDLVLALLPPESRPLEPVELDGGEGALLGRRPSGEYLVRTRGEAIWIVAGAGGRRTAEIIAERWERDAGGRPVHPGRILITGDVVPYRAEMDVLRREPAVLDEAEVEASLREGGPER